MKKIVGWYVDNGLVVVWAIYSIGLGFRLLGKVSIADWIWLPTLLFAAGYVVLLAWKKIRDWRSKDD